MRFRPPQDVVYRNLSGEEVLLNLGTGIYFGLNDSGTRLWQYLLETGDKEQVIARLKKEYDVEEPRLRQDVEDLLRKLVDKGLLICEA
jgi:hypothetical protein